MSELPPLAVVTDVLAVQTETPLPAAAYLAQLKPPGREGMEADLRRIAVWLWGPDANIHQVPWWDCRYEHVTFIKAKLEQRGYAHTTVNHHLAAFRRVLEESWLLGLMSAEDYHRATRVKSARGHREPAGRDVSDGELAAMSNVCVADMRPQGARDGALLAMAFIAGLRVSEIAALDLEDYGPDTGAVFIRHGKGGKQRRSYLEPGAQENLEYWLDQRGRGPGPIFLTIDKAGTITGRPMSRHAIKQRFAYRAAEAGVRHISPHDGRRTWVGDLLDQGKDPVSVAKLAGHSNINTTARYDRRPETAKRDAILSLHWPFRRPS